jgi:hypothetical protein
VTVAADPRTDYAAFLAERARPPRTDPVPAAVMPERLFGFQRDLAGWALEQGRAAVFADCGLGKTLVQLAWAENVHRHTGGNVLVLAPLAVGQQTVREGEACGIRVTSCREPGDVAAGVNITNYERVGRFADMPWAGLVLDESSILKAFDGKTRDLLTAFGRDIRYRLCCTATPSPNDYEELGGHSEFLGVLSRRQMLAEFFVNDGLAAAHWRLKGHGQAAFWRWLAGWSRVLRSPADLGYEADGFALPPLNVEVRTVDADAVSEDRLFAVPVATLSERRQARRESIPHRVELAAEYVNGSREPWVVWCDLNEESRQLTAAIVDAVEVTGADPVDVKEKRLTAFSRGEARVIVSKPSIAGWGLNWQHCANVLFVGLSDSYESYYQAVRRCWRFGQTRPVHVVVVASNREQAVLENIARKERQAGELFEQVARAMREAA